MEMPQGQGIEPKTKKVRTTPLCSSGRKHIQQLQIMEEPGTQTPHISDLLARHHHVLVLMIMAVISIPTRLEQQETAPMTMAATLMQTQSRPLALRDNKLDKLQYLVEVKDQIFFKHMRSPLQ